MNALENADDMVNARVSIISTVSRHEVPQS